MADKERDEVQDILDEIADAQKRMDRWCKRASLAESLYRGEKDGLNQDSDRFKILWTITEMQRPLVYDECPTPSVRRRFLEKDPPAHIGAQILERALMYAQQEEGHEFHQAICDAREDFLVAGRGQVRIVYEASIRTDPQKIYLSPEQVEELGEDEEIERDAAGVYRWSREDEPETLMKKEYERVYPDHVCWRDFVHSDGRKWKDVWWVAFGEWLTREDLIEQFGKKIGEDVPVMKAYEYEKDEHKPYSAEEFSGYKECARVWEVWDKRERKVYKVAEQYDAFLEKPQDDPLNFEGFFPCPRPVYMIKTTGSLEPVPEYKQYEDQANELYTLTGRIHRLTDSISVRGVYDKDMGAIGRLLDSRETELIPDADFARLKAMGGIESAIEWMPNAVTSDVLGKLILQRDDNLKVIWEIVGLADILRGATNARESGRAQMLKYQMVGGNRSRIGNKQKRMEIFARDVLRLMAEAIAELFSPETMIAITGVELLQGTQVGMEEILKLLRNDKLRGFRIDVETDSTVAKDEIREKEELIEFFGAISQLIGAAGSAAGMLDPNALRQLIIWGARRFPAGRDVENILEQAMAGQQQKEPSPEQMEAQAKIQKLQMDREKMVMDAQLKAAELQLKAAEMRQKGQIEQAKIAESRLEAILNLEVVKANAAGGD